MTELSHTDILLASRAKPLDPKMLALAEKFRARVIEKRSPQYRADYEVKQFEVVSRDYGKGCFVTIEIGLIGDEGTAAVHGLTR